MESAISTTERAQSASDIVSLVYQEIEAIGARLATMVPGFSSLWLVGPAADGTFDLAPSGAAWICSSDMSFVLVTEDDIPAPTLRCLTAGIGLRLGGMRVRVRHFKSRWIAQQVSKYREGFELLDSRRLIAGTTDLIDALDVSFRQSAAPGAVENLCVDTLELLLRCYPDAPMLERGRETSPLLVRGGLAEAARNLGDATLLLDGRFACDLDKRRKTLTDVLHADTSAVATTRSEITQWCYDAQAVLEEPPVPPMDLWVALRRQLVELLRRSVELRLGRELNGDAELLSHVRNCRRGLWSRIKRFLHGKKRAGGREYSQLLLLLTVLDDDEESKRKLIESGARLLGLVGGPILANPDWLKLRREALLVEPWQHLMPMKQLLESDAATNHSNTSKAESTPRADTTPKAG